MGFCVYATRRKKNRAAKKNGCAQNDLILQKLNNRRYLATNNPLRFNTYEVETDKINAYDCYINNLRKA